MKVDIRDLVIASRNQIEDDFSLEPSSNPEDLFGGTSNLDSMTLVALIADIEALIAEKTGKIITLASEKAMSRNQSPFSTLTSICEFINELLKS